MISPARIWLLAGLGLLATVLATAQPDTPPTPVSSFSDLKTSPTAGSTSSIEQQYALFRNRIRNVVEWLNPYTTPVQVSGKITFPDGQPVEEATVVLMRLRSGKIGCCPPPPPPVDVEVARTHTDAAGTYEITVPPASSSLVLKVEKPGYIPLRKPRPPGEGLASQTAPGGLMTVDVSLRPAVTLSGTVVGPDDAPAADVQVSAARMLSDQERFSGSTRNPDPETTRTDGAGRFTLDRLPEGPVLLTLAREGDGLVLRQLIDAPAPSLHLVLPDRLGSLAGNVVRTPGKRPLPDIQASLIQHFTSGTETLRHTLETTRTTSTGRYLFTSLPPGKYSVVLFTPEGMFPHGQHTISVDLAEGQDYLFPDREFFGGHEVRGRVLEAGTSRPLEGVSVTIEGQTLLTNAAGEYSRKGIPPPDPKATDDVLLLTDEQGNFTGEQRPIPNTEGPRVQALVKKEGYVAPRWSHPSDRVFLGWGPELHERVRVPSGVEVVTHDFILYSRPGLHGVVRTREGAPVAGALIGMERMYRAPGSPWPGIQSFAIAPRNVRTDEQGRFYMEVIPSVVVRVHGKAPGYGVALSDPIDTDPARMPEAVIILDKAAEVTGRVTGPAGEPVGGCPVTGSIFKTIADLSTHREMVKFSTVTAADGTFSLKDLPTSPSLILRAEPPAGRTGELKPSAEQKLQLQPGIVTRDVELKLQPGP